MKPLLLLFAGVMLLACSKEEPAPEPVRPVLSIKVKALNEENLGRFAGSIQARYESNIGFRVPGRIASRSVDVGAEVDKGALLATLDPTDQQNQLRSAEGSLASIQAQLINAQASARRQQQLFDRGVGSQAQLDSAITDLKTTPGISSTMLNCAPITRPWSRRGTPKPGKSSPLGNRWLPWHSRTSRKRLSTCPTLWSTSCPPTWSFKWPRN
jgi:hypothetical protein